MNLIKNEMSQKHNIYDDTKTEIINEIKESRILKILQYGGLAVIGLSGKTRIQTLPSLFM